MVRESSSDEEDDNQALVPQHEVKPLSPHNNHNHFAAFDIAKYINVRIRGLRSLRWQRYLLAICLPLILILVFFTLDLSHLFRGVIIIRSDSPGDRMREAELRALSLLRNQKLGLLHLCNRTVPRSNASTPSIVSPESSNSSSAPVKGDLPGIPVSVSLEEFRSTLLEQIKLNKQIQTALLSVHRGRNASLEAVDDDVDSYFPGTGVDFCRKVDRPADRRTIEWKPKKDRFLFVICLSGQMSNHLMCLEKHVFFAALLGRVLVFPSHKVDYDYSQVLDINHINQCLGREVVISYDDFVVKMKNKLKIDSFICYIASPPCYLDEEHIKRLKNLGISLGKIEAAWPEDAKLKVQKKRVVADIMPKFSSDDEVIAIGDMFYADVEEEWVMQPGGPIGHKCNALIQPSRLILLTAQRFVQTFLGSNFISLHFRRHGFLKFCNVKKESCFYPIPQAAECILSVVERANAPVIYLSTDAAVSETNLLQSLVVLDSKPVPLVKRPSHNSVEKWDALLYRNHISGDPQVMPIRGRGRSFWGHSSSSTPFTDHQAVRRAVLKQRKAFKKIYTRKRIKVREDYTAALPEKYGESSTPLVDIDGDAWMRAAGESSRGHVYDFSQGDSSGDCSSAPRRFRGSQGGSQGIIPPAADDSVISDQLLDQVVERVIERLTTGSRNDNFAARIMSVIERRLRKNDVTTERDDNEDKGGE